MARRWTRSAPCWTRRDRGPTRTLPPPPGRRLSRAGDRTVGAHRRCRARTARGCASAIRRSCSTCSADGSATMARPGCAWRPRAADGPAAGESARACGPSTAAAPRDVAGRYRCAELGAELDDRRDRRHALWRLFRLPRPGADGAAGSDRPDLWALPCPRALDHTPPGDWTLAFRRGGDGRASTLGAGWRGGWTTGASGRRPREEVSSRPNHL